MTDVAEQIIQRKEAKARGLKRYFTGKPCPHGHIAERAVNTGICLICRRAISKKWKAANQEQVRERRKQWREENPDIDRKWREENREWVRERGKAHYRKNRDRLRAYWKERYANNREAELERTKKWESENKERIRIRNQKRYAQKRDLITERNRRWREANPEKVKGFGKKWKAQNPVKVAVWRNKRRSNKLKNESHHTAEDLIAILKAQGYRCVYCQANLKKVKKHIDHVKPLSKGGSNGRENIQYLCGSCNLAKSAKDPIEFARELGLLC
jgi:5-methylcytosine-specific restriction endonuclease McrA